jgi:NAD(P)-dependent dehydrogenase (short-subunit alcohol dehydrogenase family)
MSGELKGNALVTGGSRGFGRSCARAAPRCGADVAITYLANREAARP